VSTTGKSREEACLLSEQDVEKKFVVVTTQDAGRVQPVKALFKFLASVQQEMKLVNRPSWQEVCSTTLIVIVFVFLFGLYFYVLGWIFSPLDRWLFAH
jgi:preprotein translocase SecE subunit